LFRSLNRDLKKVPRKRRFAMKRIVTIALSIAATLITSGSAFAQDHGVKATIPFNFNVGGNWMPAGTYTIGSESQSGIVLRVASPEQKVGAFALGVIDASDPGRRAEMLFHEYGDQYYLSEIHYSHSATKVRLPMSKAEKNARKHAEEASLQVNDNVLLALN
jgi:hypothetical protein